MSRVVILTLGLLGVLVGAFAVIWSKKAIDLQIGFYRKINWKLEPISWKKEIIVTKILGFFIFIIGVFVIMFFASSLLVD
ncbi:MAG: hypothetical protein ISS45_01635 [Candidatus Omnitrophica bacterium]|nr:hypothetical protein [Candidatus Omnitrophota bacterium]